MAKSSKEKICDAMYETAEFKALVKEVEERLASAQAEDFKAIYSDYDRKASIQTTISTTHLGVKKTSAVSAGHISAPYWSISRNVLYSEDDLKAVFKANFGKLKPGSTKKMLVPTYNVKKDVAFEEFRTRGLDRLGELASDAIRDCSVRIRTQVLSFMTTDEAKTMCQEATDRYTIDTIKATLLRFKDARPELLKAAMDEFVCHAIMEG